MVGTTIAWKLIMKPITEICYFLQWYWTKQKAKVKGIEYKPAFWHFTFPIIIAGIGIVLNSNNVEAF
jgi:hypothetical protein